MKPAPRWLVAALVAAWLAASAAAADPQSKSHSVWTVQGSTVELRYEVAGYELTRLREYQQLGDLKALALSYLAPRLSVHRGGVRCAADAPSGLPAPLGTLRVAMRFHCSEHGALAIRLDAFFDQVPSHLHFASARMDDGQRINQLLSRRQATLRIGDGSAAANSGHGRGAVFWNYLQAGTRHLLSGVDHLAFLLGLLLLSRRLLDVTVLITGFTIGHSITLSLATLDVIQPDAAPVEALIGFTVALVGAEYIALANRAQRAATLLCGGLFIALALLRPWQDSGPALWSLLGLALLSACYLSLSADPRWATRSRTALVTLFGMVHGLGFAGVLQSVGLPDAWRFWALLSFNLGVEIGQLMIVAALIAVSMALSRWLASQRDRLFECLATALCAVGFYWYFDRAF